MYVVFKSKEEHKIFEYLFHFQARKLENGNYEIIDILGRGRSEEISSDEFEKNFIVIKQAEYEEYERYVNEGDTDLIDQYLERLSTKYSI